MEHLTLITAIAGLVFGVLGAVLGVINTWRAISRDRIKVKVLPVWILSQRGTEGIGIEITNLSYMPVTIRLVGFTVRGDAGYIPALDGVYGGGRFPQRMEPRTQITAFVGPATYQHSNFARVNKTFVETACGRKFYGTSDALIGHVKKIASAGN